MKKFEVESKQKQNQSNVNSTNPYTSKYRVLKTLLMLSAWVSFGYNQELARITLGKCNLNVIIRFLKLTLLTRGSENFT
jgi:hypothetical protein